MEFQKEFHRHLEMRNNFARKKAFYSRLTNTRSLNTNQQFNSMTSYKMMYKQADAEEELIVQTTEKKIKTIEIYFVDKIKQLYSKSNKLFEINWITWIELSGRHVRLLTMHFPNHQHYSQNNCNDCCQHQHINWIKSVHTTAYGSARKSNTIIPKIRLFFFLFHKCIL